MSTLDTPAGVVTGARGFDVRWGCVFAGAVAGAGLALVLDGFASAVGLAVSSSAPTWRDASFALAFLSGLYLILAALLSYGFGAFVATRLRPSVGLLGEERDYNDGLHGLIVWGVMTVATALIALALAAGVTKLAEPARTTTAQSVAGENIIALDLDRLFRDGGRLPPGANMDLYRGEAARILLTTSSHRGMLPEDEAYLVRMVQGVTGLSPGDARTRVTQVAASAKQNISRARNSGVIIAFMAAAAALLGAIAAWFAACAGGRQREGIADIWTFTPWSWQTDVRR